MPNKRNAEKAIRQDEKRVTRNQAAKAELKTLRTQLRKALVAGGEKALALQRAITKKADKAVSRGILKKNKAARIKSRAAIKLNQAERKTSQA